MLKNLAGPVTSEEKNIYIFIYIFTQIYIHIYIYAHTCKYIYVVIYVVIHANLCIWTYLEEEPCGWGRAGAPRAGSPRPRASAVGTYLRKRVLKLVFLSQVPFKFINLFFTLRISWQICKGIDLGKRVLELVFWDKNGVLNNREEWRVQGLWFRGGLVFNAHRLLQHSTLGSRVMKKKKIWTQHCAPEAYCAAAPGSETYTYISYEGWEKYTYISCKAAGCHILGLLWSTRAFHVFKCISKVWFYMKR